MENNNFLESYNIKVNKDVDKYFDYINKLKSSGVDGDSEVAIQKTNNLIERVLGLISVKENRLRDLKIQDNVKQRVLELENIYSKSDWRVAMKIALDFAQNKFIKFSDIKESIELGIRFGFAYITSGVVSSPLEGFVGLDIRKTLNGKEYFALNYAGPIRNAGGTAASVCVLIADYIRKTLNYSKYDPTEDEINRVWVELSNYHERVANLQYFPTKEETYFFFKNIPIQIDGDPTSDIEVSNYKNLGRIKTNRIRGGFCLVCSECLQLKAQKLHRRLNDWSKEMNMEDWDFLTKYLEKQKEMKSKEESNESNINTSKEKIKKNYSYLKEISAGKPVFSYPMEKGFRIRYGRTRLSGYSCVSMNPMSMRVLDDFIAVGSQIKTERPFKGATVTPCETIEGPVVILNNGSLIKVRDEDIYLKIKNEIKSIIHVGDILVNFGDFYNRDHYIIPSGFVEEWWIQELIESLKVNNVIQKESLRNDILTTEALEDYFNLELFNNQIGKDFNLNFEDLKKRIFNYLNYEFSFLEALNFSLVYKIPLHPRHLFFLSNINLFQYENLIESLKESKIFFKKSNLEDDYLKFYDSIETIVIKNKEIIDSTNENNKITIKEIIENLNVEHSLSDNNIIIKSDVAKSFIFYFIQITKKEITEFINSDMYVVSKDFKIENNYSQEFSKVLFYTEKILTEDIFKQVNKKYVFEIIKKKNSMFMGLRLGRPEKAKPREIKGSVNGLFTFTEKSNKFEDMLLNNSKIYSQKYICDSCGLESPLSYCINCKKKLEKESFSVSWKDEKQDFGYWDFDSKKYFQKFKEIYKLENSVFENVKPMKDLRNKERFTEHYLKGIFRNKYNLNANKDGTIRYDSTESPMTHFKPKEIHVSVEKLKSMGYNVDIKGKEISSEDQIIELFPQDIIISDFKEYNNISSVDFFYNVTKYIDDLLINLYNSKPFYDLKSREDIIGNYVIGLSPHTSAGVVARIIGFSKTQCLFAHPFFHAALRRDCDGDEAGLMLLIDGLLNFSNKFSSNNRGSTMDRPLVLSVVMDPGEVDDMAFDIDINNIYSLDFYKKTMNLLKPNSFKDDFLLIQNLIDENYSYNKTSFTHKVENLNNANLISSYKYLPTMFDKVKKEVELMYKLKGVDAINAIELMINKFFIKDMKGNLKKFSGQSLRCTKCNKIMRRPPLNGKCINCGEQNLVFTIAQNSIVKYVEIMKYLDNNLDRKNYTHEILDYLFSRINSLFEKDETLQLELF